LIELQLCDAVEPGEKRIGLWRVGEASRGNHAKGRGESGHCAR